ncbi:MAG: hypothetical protein QW134_09145, partial [Nitrososphaeria archaeon]
TVSVASASAKSFTSAESERSLLVNLIALTKQDMQKYQHQKYLLFGKKTVTFMQQVNCLSY